VPDLESLSQGELVEFARTQAIRIDEQAAVIARQNAQITVLSTQLADLMDMLEQQTGELAKLWHFLSRNSANSSKDDDPGRTPPGRPQRVGRPGAVAGAVGECGFYVEWSPWQPVGSRFKLSVRSVVRDFAGEHPQGPVQKNARMRPSAT
jgi:uncharacterized coiled-coil protein SlyX